MQQATWWDWWGTGRGLVTKDAQTKDWCRVFACHGWGGRGFWTRWAERVAGGQRQGQQQQGAEGGLCKEVEATCKLWVPTSQIWNCMFWVQQFQLMAKQINKKIYKFHDSGTSTWRPRVSRWARAHLQRTRGILSTERNFQQRCQRMLWHKRI